MMEAVVIPPFERFYDEHRDEVFGVLVRRLGRQRAEDAFQETFLRALRAYPALKHGEYLRAWVLTIARNVPSTPSAVTADAELEEPVELPRRPAYAELEHLTGELPPTERAAVVLRYAYDMPYAAIGAALGSSEDAARQAASAGVRRLEKGARMTVPTDLDRRFRDAADREGLVDVAYDLADSPVGELLVAVTERGLCRIAYRPDDALDELAARLRRARPARSAPHRPRPPRAGRVLRRLAAASSTCRSTSPPSARSTARRCRARPRPLRPGDDLRRAREEGRHPTAARAIGGAMNRNPIPIVLPCHRVVGANGIARPATPAGSTGRSSCSSSRAPGLTRCSE